MIGSGSAAIKKPPQRIIRLLRRQLVRKLILDERERNFLRSLMIF
jgi:hypothetical protein